VPPTVHLCVAQVADLYRAVTGLDTAKKFCQVDMKSWLVTTSMELGATVDAVVPTGPFTHKARRSQQRGIAAPPTVHLCIAQVADLYRAVTGPEGDGAPVLADRRRVHGIVVAEEAPKHLHGIFEARPLAAEDAALVPFLASSHDNGVDCVPSGGDNMQAS